MSPIMRMMSLLCIALMLSAAAVVASLALAGRAEAAGPVAEPTTVVTVNMPAVLEKLKQRSQAEADLQAFAEAMQASDKERKDAIKEMKQQLDAMPKQSTPARQQLEDKLSLALLELEAWQHFATEQIDIEKSTRLRDLDKSVRDAIRELAEVNGYDIVLTDDSDVELTANRDANVPLEIQVKQQMVKRRILYANPTVDVTDELIERMNNAFALNAPAPPRGAAGPAASPPRSAGASPKSP